MKIVAQRNDDRGFLQEVQKLIVGILPCYRPGEVFLVRIDDWFDRNRLGLKICPPDDAAVARCGTQLPVPWFSRGRIVAAQRFRFEDDQKTSLVAQGNAVSTMLTANRYKSVAQISDNAMFVWLSGNSARNGKGSLLIYFTQQGIDTGWYAGYSSQQAWHVARICAVAA